MSYQVLARKYRPKSFSEVIGQEHVLRTLENALLQNRLHHAYLFTGTRGVGKTTLGRILAKCLNCETGITGAPCGKCEACLSIDAGKFIDLIEIDAASRTKVEDMREILQNVQYTPTNGRYKIYLIDEVHMLSGHSFNALLKTLEEPPEHVKFFLATTDKQRLPITILSRCLQFNLKNVPAEKILAHLKNILGKENINYEENALRSIAIAATGSVRDALSLLDQAIAYGAGTVNSAEVNTMLGTIETDKLFKLCEALANNDPQEIFTLISELSDLAVDFGYILDELLTLLHRIAIIQNIPDCNTENWENILAISKLAKTITSADIQLYYQIGLIGKRDLSLAPSPRLGFEMTLLRMLAFQPEKSVKNNIIKQTDLNIPKKEPIKEPDKIEISIQAKLPKEEPVKNVTNQNESDIPDLFKILPHLTLSGTTQALIRHCVIGSQTPDTLELLLDPAQAPFLSVKQEERLTQAFSDYLNKPIQVTIKLGQPGMNTKSEIESQKAKIANQNAVDALKVDPNIQTLVDVFDAEIIPDTIK